LTDIQNVNENVLVGALLTAAATLGSNSGACPTNSYYYNGSCYSYQSTLYKSWTDAEAYCVKTYGGHLASIQNLNQQNFIWQNVTKNCTGCSIFGHWVGGNNYGNPNNWKWSDASLFTTFPRLTKYAYWPLQPDNPTTQQCMTIVKPDGGWGDWYCWYAETFVCQFTPASSTAWIGLQKATSGRVWNIGSSCTPRTATYQNVNTAAEDPSKIAYTYSSISGMWSGASTSSMVSAAVCRKDKNICGRAPCPSCSTCTATNSGKCYSCSGIPTPTTSTVPTTAPAVTASSVIACSTSGATTNWWCAKTQTAGQAIASAVAADSCFCVMQKNQTQQQASDSCIATGGFLTDIQNAAENSLMSTIMATYNASSTPTTTSACPTGATLFNGMCYIYFPYMYKNYNDAEKYCQTKYGGHLPSISSSQIQTFLFTTLSMNCKGCTIFGMWVGANNTKANPSMWTWADGSGTISPTMTNPRLTAYKGWAKQPDYPSSQQCMTLVKPDGGWADWYCWFASPFACAFASANSSPWIGLQKTLSGPVWNDGNKCQPTPATYTNLNSATALPANTAYVYKTDGTWMNVDGNSFSSTAICRKDNNVCGRNMCPACSTCTSSYNGMCYTCA
jgi:hypothetical protein